MADNDFEGDEVFFDDVFIEMEDEIVVEEEHELLDDNKMVTTDDTIYANITSLLYDKYRKTKDSYLSNKVKNYSSLLSSLPNVKEKIANDTIVPVVDLKKVTFEFDEKTITDFLIDDKNIKYQKDKKGFHFLLDRRIKNKNDIAVNVPHFVDSTDYHLIENDRELIYYWARNSEHFEKLRGITGDSFNIIGFINTPQLTSLSTSVITFDIQEHIDEILKADKVTDIRNGKIYKLKNKELLNLNEDNENILVDDNVYIPVYCLYSDTTQKWDPSYVYNKIVFVKGVTSKTFNCVRNMLSYSVIDHIKTLTSSVVSTDQLSKICLSDPFQYVNEAKIVKNFIEDNVKQYSELSKKNSKKNKERLSSGIKKVKKATPIGFLKNLQIDGTNLYHIFKQLKENKPGGDLLHFLHVLQQNKKESIFMPIKYNLEYHLSEKDISSFKNSDIYMNAWELLNNKSDKSKLFLVQNAYTKDQNVLEFSKNLEQKDIKNTIHITEVLKEEPYKVIGDKSKLNSIINLITRESLIKNYNDRKQLDYNGFKDYSIYQGKTNENIKDEIGEQGVIYNRLDVNDDEIYVVTYDEKSEEESLIYNIINELNIVIPQEYFDICTRAVLYVNSRNKILVDKEKKKKNKSTAEINALIIAYQFYQLSLVLTLLCMYLSNKSSKSSDQVNQLDDAIIRYLVNSFKNVTYEKVYSLLNSIKYEVSYEVDITTQIKSKSYKLIKEKLEFVTSYFISKNEDKSKKRKAIIEFLELGRGSPLIPKLKQIKNINISLNSNDQMNEGSLRQNKVKLISGESSGNIIIINDLSSSINLFLKDNIVYSQDQTLISLSNKTNKTEWDKITNEITKKFNNISSYYNDINTIQELLLRGGDTNYQFKLLSKTMRTDLPELIGKNIWDYKLSPDTINRKKHLLPNDKETIISLTKNNVKKYAFPINKDLKDRVSHNFRGVQYLDDRTVIPNHDLYERLIILTYVFVSSLEFYTINIKNKDDKAKFLKELSSRYEMKLNNNNDDFQSIMDEFEKQREEKKQRHMSKLKSMSNEDRILNKQLRERGVKQLDDFVVYDDKIGIDEINNEDNKVDLEGDDNNEIDKEIDEFDLIDDDVDKNSDDDNDDIKLYDE